MKPIHLALVALTLSLLAVAPGQDGAPEARRNRWAGLHDHAHEERHEGHEAQGREVLAHGQRSVERAQLPLDGSRFEQEDERPRRGQDHMDGDTSKGKTYRFMCDPRIHDEQELQDDLVGEQGLKLIFP